MPITTIALRTDDINSVRIADAVVEFYDTIGSFQTSGITNVDGEVTVILPAADYDIYMFKIGMIILPKQPQRITVLTQVPPNSFLVTAHIRVMPEGPDPELCRVSGFIMNSHGRSQKGVKITIGPLLELVNIGGRLVDPDHQVDVMSDSNGYLEFDLLRGISYEAFVLNKTMWKEMPPGRLIITAPDSPSLLLSYLLFPVPERVVFSAESVDVIAGESDDTTTITITYTDKNNRQAALQWGTYQLINSNPNVFGYEVAGDTLIIKGVSPGTATLTATRTLGTGHWDPEPPFSADVLTVVVS